MSAINAVLRPLFDIVLAPLSGLPAIVGVTLFSLVFGVVALWLVKLTSDSKKVDAAKRKVAAGLLEIRLFNDNLGVIFKAVASILKHQAIYVGRLGVPFVLMILLFLPIIAQLQFHWGHVGLDEGDSVVFKVALEEDWEQTIGNDGGGDPARPRLELDMPDGLSLTSPPVWSPGDREMAWQLQADAEGDYEIGIVAGDTRHTKIVGVTDRVVRLSPDRLEGTFANQLLYPAEPSFASDSGLVQAGLKYPTRDIWFFFWHTHWLIVMLVLSVVFALLLRGPMGVTI